MRHRVHQRRGPHGHGRHRARRGALGASVLTLLAERPMHGYELIGALEERSGGRWKPSPGSIYPALDRLEQRGFVTSIDDDGRRRYELTDAGRDRVDALRDAGTDAPWEEHGLGRHGDLRRAIAELVGPARQIGRFGSPDQIAAALATVQEATTRLYRILADGPRESGTDPAAGGPTDTGSTTDET